MKRCLELASKGCGAVSPNPMVGAVIVKNGRIIAEGYHKKYGGPHAEVDALNNVVEDVRGAFLYCNLEPCCHTNKQTPPCVPFIINKEIAKVVISNSDPNPDVNGEGVKKLRAAGIKVQTGIIEDEGRELNKFYFKYVSSKIPYITLKIAQSLDGKISRGNNQQIWLTGEESSRFVHQQRAAYDAVLVGANTVAIDNPLLTVRDFKGRNPQRLILDGKLSIDIYSAVLSAADIENTWILTGENADKDKIDKILKKGAKVIRFNTDKNNQINLSDILTRLGEYKITSLFVEGGGDIFSQFIKGNLFDEIIVLQAPITLGEGIRGISGSSLLPLIQISSEYLGVDLKLVYQKR